MRELRKSWNPTSPREIHDPHKNSRIPRENHENHENARMPCEN